MNEDEAKTETTKEEIIEKRAPYEIGYLISGKLTKEDAETYATQLATLIQDSTDGILTEETRPQRQRLSYPIKKEFNAYFGLVYFEAAKKRLKKLGEKLKLEQNLLRHLVLSSEPEKRSLARPAPFRRKPPVKKIEEKERPREEIKMKELEKKLEEIIEG